MLGKVSIAIEAAMASFESDMGRAARLLEKETRRMGMDAKRLEAEMKRVGKVVGTAIVAGLAAASVAIKRVINQFDDMSKASQRVGMSTEAFSRLVYAGQLADVSMQDLQTSIGRLVRTQGEAMNETSRMGLLFKTLGVDVKDAAGQMRSGEAVLHDFADRFQELGGSQEAINAGIQIFGRNFQNLIPLLKDGSQGLKDAADESDRLGFTLSQKTGEAAEEFNDNITRLQTAMGGLWKQIAADLLPDLVRLTQQMVEWVKEGERGAGMADTLATGIRGVVTVAQSAINLISGLANAVGGFAKQVQGFADIMEGIRTFDGDLIAKGQGKYGAGSSQIDRGIRGIVDPATSGVFAGGKGYADYKGPLLAPSKFVEEAELKAEAARIKASRARAAALAKLLGDPTGGGAGKGSKGAKAGKSDADREADRLLKLYERETASLQRQAEMMGKSGEAARVAYEIKAGELAKLEPAQQAELTRLAQIADAERERHETQEAGKRLIEQLMTPTERVNQQLAKAARLLEAGEIAQADYNKAVAAYQTPAQDMIASLREEIMLFGMSRLEQMQHIAVMQAGTDATEEQIATIRRLVAAREQAYKTAQQWDEVERNFAQTFYDLAKNVGDAENIIKSFFDRLADQILRSISEGWAERITDIFKGMASGSGGSGGSNWFTNLFSAFFGGKREHGGAVYKDRLYEVGERGKPEILSAGGKTYLIPGNDGEVTPMKSGAAGFTQINHIHYRAPYDPRTEAQKNARLEFETRRAMARVTA